MSIQDGSVGKLDFIKTHGLWNEEQQEAAKSVAASVAQHDLRTICLLYTSPSPRDGLLARMPSSA